MPVAVIRYQYDNHLGSASLELDATAQIISYEEYHPFGSTSYRSGKSETEVSLKRYKYVGKEKDEETGLYYYGFRYYAPWIARFINVDPLQHEYPHYTPFQYAGNKPITYVDLDGLEEMKKDEEHEQKRDPGNFVFQNKEAENWHFEKITPVYKTNKEGVIVTRRGKPILDRDSNYDPFYASVVRRINSEQNLKVVVKRGYPPQELECNCSGAVIPADDNGPDAKTNILFVFFEKPTIAHGGNWRHVLAEEIFHLKQGIESVKWKEERKLPDYNAKMEVKAKEFSAGQGGNFEVYYQSGDRNIPTEMGIMSGSDKFNWDISKEDYLSMPLDMYYWMYINTNDGREKRPFIFRHEPTYKFKNKPTHEK